MKYKLYIRQYDITTNDNKEREEIVETNDIYHEIGKIYSNAFTEIKRIDYEKIDETKELKQEIERLNNIINELEKYLKEQKEIWVNDVFDEVFNKLQELKGSDK